MQPMTVGRWTVALVIGVLSGLACGGRAPVQPDPPPAPTPAPVTVTGGFGCGLPPGTGAGVNCPYDVATFVEPVDQAIARTQAEHPELFDFSQCHSTLSCLVLDRQRYIAEVVFNLQRAELCAFFDGEEIAIKNTNDFSDQYHVLTSTSFSRWGIGSYRATCRPAWF